MPVHEKRPFPDKPNGRQESERHHAIGLELRSRLILAFGDCVPQLTSLWFDLENWLLSTHSASTNLLGFFFRSSSDSIWPSFQCSRRYPQNFTISALCFRVIRLCLLTYLRLLVSPATFFHLGA